MQVIPFTSDPAQELSVQLGDGKFTLEARYNDRSASWTFDVTRDADQVTLLTGVPLLLGGDMLAPYALHIGGLVAQDLSNKDLDAGPDDLGERVIVTWLSEDELAFLRGAGLLQSLGSEGNPGAGGDTGGGGGGTGGDAGGSPVPLVDTQLHGDASGNEVLVSQFTADLSGNGNPTITLNLAFLAMSAAGTATYRAYVGGTIGVINGTLIGTTTQPSSSFSTKTINGTLSNPGGTTLVKVTIQSSGPGADAFSDDLTGTLG